MRVITSPAVSWHSWPSPVTARSLATTNVRLAGSRAAGTSSLVGELVADACGASDAAGAGFASVCSAASCAFTSSAIAAFTSGVRVTVPEFAAWASFPPLGCDCWAEASFAAASLAAAPFAAAAFAAACAW